MSVFSSLVFFLSSSLLSSSELGTVRQFYDGATGVTVPVINFLTREGIISPSPLCSLGEVGEIGQYAHLGQLDGIIPVYVRQKKREEFY